MSKLYVFGIGGTGARVLRSLTMLLASGVRCDKDIVPVLIDPDDSADCRTKSVKAFDLYSKIRNRLHYPGQDTHFFGTSLEENVSRYYIQLNNTSNKTFSQYISHATMSEENKALMQMLFSNENLKSSMEVGFKGNPNMGCVVLNQFVQSDAFNQFANGFSQGDSIFIVSSIFGGTGASGFPLLLKTLRGNKELPKFKLINNAPIGGIIVLPYFSVTVDPQSSIDSSCFIDKTKAALAYYDTNISGTNSIDRLYYIADTKMPTYDNVEGGVGQANSSHVVELFSATAVIDFAGANVQNNNTTQCFEFGIKNDVNHVSFSDLGQVTYAQISKPLTQFLLFQKYLENVRKSQFRHQPWAIDPGFDKIFFDSGFEKDVESFLHLYEEWLQELADNNRSFVPFDLNACRHVFRMVKNIPEKSSLFDNYALFDKCLNTQKRPNGISKEQWFIELFFNATQQLVEKKLNF